MTLETLRGEYVVTVENYKTSGGLEINKYVSEITKDTQFCTEYHYCGVKWLTKAHPAFKSMNHFDSKQNAAHLFGMESLFING